MSDFAIVITGAMLFIAYVNGANDNFKGVATLFGSGVTDYRKALWWASGTTVAGSLTSLFLATRLVSVFQGKDLVPSFLIESPSFLAAVILGAAITVFVATLKGVPVSTTHGLTGALMGGGMAAVGFNLSAGTLFYSFLFPLLLSPLIAVVLSIAIYPLLSAWLHFADVDKQTCVCVGNEMVPASVTPEGCMLSSSAHSLGIVVDHERQCVARFTDWVWGINVQKLLDYSHYLSAGAVSFARGLNDTPKIVALGLATNALGLESSIGFVAIAMILGGLINARKVAQTMSKRITTMEPAQGCLANMVTSGLVICASLWGLPVSTTHVSCGSLFGIGMANRQASWGVIRTILLAWVLTLPIAALSAGVIYILFTQLAWV
jgi:inorganic phosphate transporter, PiT family